MTNTNYILKKLANVVKNQEKAIAKLAQMEQENQESDDIKTWVKNLAKLGTKEVNSALLKVHFSGVINVQVTVNEQYGDNKSLTVGFLVKSNELSSAEHRALVKSTLEDLKSKVKAPKDYELNWESPLTVFAKQ